MERVGKGEKYWIITQIGLDACYVPIIAGEFKELDDDAYNKGNYFHTKEEAESMARKLRAVLKGADVIEMPSEEDIKNAQKHIEDEVVFNIRTDGQQLIYCKAINKGAEMMADWLKSKTIK